MTIPFTPIALRALLVTVVAAAAVAVLPQVALGQAPPPDSVATEQQPSEGPTGTGESGPSTVGEAPVDPTAPPAGESAPLVDETLPPTGQEPPPEQQEVLPPAPAEEPPVLADPAPIVIIEEEIIATEVIAIPVTPDAPKAPRTGAGRASLAPPVFPSADPDPVPPIAARAESSYEPASATHTELPAPSLATILPSLPADPIPPLTTSAPAVTSVAWNLDQLVNDHPGGQSIVADPLAADVGAPETARPAVDPFEGVQTAIGSRAGEQASLLQVLASYVIPGASGSASTVQFFLAFALLLGAFAFARPRNWRIALPDVPGEPHAGHGSVGLRPG